MSPGTYLGTSHSDIISKVKIKKDRELGEVGNSGGDDGGSRSRAVAVLSRRGLCLMNHPGPCI